MSTIVLQRPDNILPSSQYSGGSGPAQEQAVCMMEAGETLVLRCRYSEFYNSGIAIPAPIVGEGPYLRIRPHFNRLNSRQVNAAQANTADPIARQPAGTINSAMRQNDGFFYEIDAQNCQPFTAPWSCSVTLATGLSGIWAFDYAKFAAGNDEVGYQLLGKPDNNDLYSHTRLVWNSAAAAASRTVEVPIGAVSMQGVGWRDATSLVAAVTELTSKTAGNFTSQIENYNTAVGNPPDRIPCPGPIVVIRSGASGQAAGVAFWCKLL